MFYVVWHTTILHIVSFKFRQQIIQYRYLEIFIFSAIIGDS
ncbi:hypothetical protein LHK_02000 [Laribacter hongkongensis HLHK9]|uniref:Uncharacterized protein n=1 Tax=Laribacter hongkongensis (strain HLHK9) TaxID=557598 RepID=C1D944_LARHH|nr:hypothetical protein LHK_02000 [Laribacter hongkongensis HLHK9]